MNLNEKKIKILQDFKKKIENQEDSDMVLDNTSFLNLLKSMHEESNNMEEK